MVIAPHVVTVDVVSPGLALDRMQTFASFLETSIPAHRGCTTSITHHHLRRGGPRNDRNSLLGCVFRGGRSETGI